jgi:predicted acyl esterase
MKKLFTFLFFIFYFLQLSAQTNSQDSAWVKENFIKKEVMIPMRDGIKLFTAIYIPKDATEKHPILITRTPYSCAPYGEANFSQNLWQRHWRYYARENYIIVVQDVRGRWMR